MGFLLRFFLTAADGVCAAPYKEWDYRVVRPNVRVIDTGTARIHVIEGPASSKTRKPTHPPRKHPKEEGRNGNGGCNASLCPVQSPQTMDGISKHFCKTSFGALVIYVSDRALKQLDLHEQNARIDLACQVAEIATSPITPEEGKTIVLPDTTGYQASFTMYSHHEGSEYTKFAEKIGVLRGDRTAYGRLVGDIAQEFRFAGMVIAWPTTPKMANGSELASKVEALRVIARKEELRTEDSAKPNCP